MHTCTCHTPDCGNADVPVELQLTYTDEFGDEQTVGSVVCGVCSEPITDVDPPLDAP